jgi:hypothetical protein
MRRCPFSLCLAVLSLMTLGVAFPQSGAAQQSPQDAVSFKATMVTPLAQVVVVEIPLTPPIHSVTVTGKGESDLLGSFTFVAHHFGRPGIDGLPVDFTDGLSVISGANGDALFVTYNLLFRPTAATETLFPFEGGFIITGGKGKFVGAIGSGRSTLAWDFGKMNYTQTWEGTVSRPKQ